jgi:ABC-type antimicrobial peptide transport system permease subunit
MLGLLTVLPIVIRRVKANARLLLAVVAGAVLAAAIMSTTSIYTDAIRDLGLKYALDERGEDEINITIVSSSQSSGVEYFNRTQKYIATTAKDELGGVLDAKITVIARSSTFFPSAPGQPYPPDESRPRSHFHFITGAEDHLTVDGRLPSDASLSGAGAPSIEVAVGSETAQRIGLKIGDRFDLHPFWEPNVEPVHVTVVGIVSQIDPDEAFWIKQTDLLSFRSTSWDTIPFLISRETFFDAVAAYLPSMISDYTTLMYVDTGAINARNADSVLRSMTRFQTGLSTNVLRSSMTTQLPDVLTTFDEKLFFTRIPLLVLVLQIAAIVLYYLFMVSTMLIERQSGEIALLKSRGATTAQVMKVYMVEGLAIFIIAMVVGPPLAAIVISLLGQTPPFTDLTGGSNLSVHLSAGAYLWAGGGALLAFVTLLVPAYLATRRTVIQQRAASARPSRQPFFMRYYLDLGLAGAGGILLYQLDRRGGLVTEGFFGEQKVDPVMLLAPAFFILTVGIVFLRLFPLVLRVLAWIVARAQGAAVLIGMWQLVRNPVHYSRLVLLLMLATAVGMFAASFGATLETSYADRAYYESGAAWRLREARTLPSAGPNGSADVLAEQIGAEAATAVFRVSASQGELVSRLSVDILAVDADSFADVAYYRGDFSGESLTGLMSKLREQRPEELGVRLPADAHWLGIWVNPVEMLSAFSLQMEAFDATGRYFSYLLGPDDVRQMQRGWNLLVTDLTRPGINFTGTFVRRNTAFDRVNGPYPILEPQAPLTVTSITLRSPTRQAAPFGTIQFDDMHTTASAIDPTLEAQKALYDPERAGGGLPNATAVYGFDTTEDWIPLQGLLPAKLNDQTRTAPAGGFTALELSWQPQQGQLSGHGLQFSSGAGPMPVLASRGFMEGSGLKVGDVTNVFLANLFTDVQIVDTYDLFPTLSDPRSSASMVADGPTLAALINLNPGGPLQYPNEIWFEGSEEALGNLRNAIQSGAVGGQVVSFEELQLAQQKDPLVAAGWEGILFISFAAILILSAIGFLIYSYLTAQRRTLEFAILRTMGFSKKQIAIVVGFEQVFVIGLGMVAGTLMGMRLGSLMIRYMGLTETGDEVLPPMHLEISWFTVGTAWLVLGLVFLVTIGAVVLLYSRLALHRVLRIGET